MEKEGQKFKEAEVKAQLEQDRVIFSEPIYVPIGNKNIEIRPLTLASSVRVSKYSVMQDDFGGGEPTNPNIVAIARKNMKMQAKAVSIAILNDNRLYGLMGVLKRTLFFWIHWRIVMNRFDSATLNAIFMAMVEKFGGSFFFQNMALVKNLNILTKKKTKEEAKQLQAEQKSD